MKTILSAVTVAGMLAADLSYAQSGADVVKTKGCVACHAADQKKVHPRPTSGLANPPRHAGRHRPWGGRW
jgi:cytochrome c551/c552